ncbi:hypothetical protein J43TS9_36190 [Paenibacillus cineris]|nr:hypothetical protein J43TS9_36190 [Paenibacillus cineris]
MNLFARSGADPFVVVVINVEELFLHVAKTSIHIFELWRITGKVARLEQAAENKLLSIAF